MNFRFSHQTDTGKKRSLNEDYLAFDESLGLFIVCDGMGGHQAGDIASKLGAQTLMSGLCDNSRLRTLLKASDDSTKRKQVIEILSEAINVANRAIYEYSLKMTGDEAKSAGMGTTLVMALKTENGVFIAHVGDSRAYLMRGKSNLALTEDHSFVNELLRAGQISPEQAKKHPQRNMILRAMGVSEVVCPDIIFYEIMDGDMIILCSDGLHDYCSNNDFLRFRRDHSFEDLTSEMINHALNGGGKDNITVMVLEWGSSDGPPMHPHDITVQTKIETLMKINLFKALTYKETTQLLEVIRIKHVEEDMELITEGDAGEEMYLILKGEVEVIIDGKLVTELKPGNYFGEMSLIDKSPRSATIRSKGACKLMHLEREELFPLLKREPRIGLKIFWAFLQTMNQRLRDNNKLLQNIGPQSLNKNWDLEEID